MEVQKRLYDRLSVKVDQVIQGHGTSNTGNLARRCFSQPKIFAEALEIDHKLVANLAIILSAFSCKCHLKLDLLESFCEETYSLYYELYPWARMSPTVHKLLKHGCDIARELPLPVAFFAEDANESWHKLYRQYMIYHSRQDSRANRIIDVFHRALYFSDPLISNILLDNRIKSKEKKYDNSEDIQKFINDE